MVSRAPSSCCTQSQSQPRRVSLVTQEEWIRVYNGLPEARSPWAKAMM